MEKPIPESKALPPRDPAKSDENDWPEYQLRSVEVTARNGRLATLLHADPKEPVTVTGRLDLEGRKAGLLLPYAASKSRTPVIQIKDVTHFSYGAYQNGDVDIWASGEAGWYRIKPAESYVDVFQEMIEAVNILYFTSDCYKSGKLSWEDLFAKYAQIHHISVAESNEKFHSHARFLASRMQKGEEGIKWGHTGFYQHLRRVHPEAFGVKSPATVHSHYGPLKIQKDNSVSSLSRSNSRIRTRRSDASKGMAATESSKSRGTRKRPSLISGVNKAKAITLWKFMQKVVNENRPDPTLLTIEEFARYLMQTFMFEDENEAGNFIQYLAVDLVSMMQQKRRRTYEWTELPVYDELLETKLSAATKRKMAAVGLERRAQPLPDDNDDEISSIESDSSEEQIADEDEIHHTKSGLRPKSTSKFSGKGAAGKGKGKAPHNRAFDESDNLSEPIDVEPMDVDRPTKRKDVPEEDDQDTPFKKRFTRSQGDQDPELEDLEFAWQQARSTGLPIRRKTEPHLNGESTQLRATVVSEPLFNTEATEPGDVWTCGHDGCLHKVYGASDATSKVLIKEHLDDHKAQASNATIDLILSEQNRTHLPVRLDPNFHSFPTALPTPPQTPTSPSFFPKTPDSFPHFNAEDYFPETPHSFHHFDAQHYFPVSPTPYNSRNHSCVSVTQERVSVNPKPKQDLSRTPGKRRKFFARKAEEFAIRGDVVFKIYGIEPINNKVFRTQQPHKANPRNGGVAAWAYVRYDDGSYTECSDYDYFSSAHFEEDMSTVQQWLDEVKDDDELERDEDMVPGNDGLEDVFV